LTYKYNIMELDIIQRAFNELNDITKNLKPDTNYKNCTNCIHGVIVGRSRYDKIVIKCKQGPQTKSIGSVDERSLNQKNATQILILPNSDMMDALNNELLITNKFLYIDRGFFCVGSGGDNNCGDKSLSRFRERDYVCNFDTVIDYDAQFSYDRYGLIHLPDNSSIHQDVFKPLVANWQECKSQYKLLARFKDKPDTSGRYIQDVLIYSKV